MEFILICASACLAIAWKAGGQSNYVEGEYPRKQVPFMITATCESRTRLSTKKR